MLNPASREEQIFNAALQFATREERSAYLKGACAGDAALLQRVETLLLAHERAGASLDPDVTVKSPSLPDMSSVAPVNERPGDRIGRYKLLQEIGEGGCGVVYMAEQEEPVRRQIALKVIKLGMDTKQVIARFEAERQALALMDHPNIAKVLDAGATETGRPYFVMELVRGVPITEYCNQNSLSTRERLDLFIEICRAIQHAHQKGIIHRDIKPNNILVTLHDGVPVPKVIDFGIAKATSGQRLTDKTLFTAFEQFVGTPVYMSPEQAEMSGLDIDTRTDIYALGVLLYELLTGKTPFDAKRLQQAAFDEIRRIIREEEPLRPSTRLSTLDAAEQTTIAKQRQSEPPKLLGIVRGDLDWIAMKCLEKDRTRRYETANGLSMDIQRYLTNEPVVARPPSNLYRFQKLVRRNKLAFAAASAVAVALVTGLSVSTWLFVKEKAARQRAAAAEQKAKTEAAKSGQVAQFLKDMLNSVGPSVALGRDTTMMREIVDKTAERIGTDLKDHPEVEIDLRLTLAHVYSDLQDYRKVEQTARETLRLARAHFGEENLAVADSLGRLGRALMYLREMDEAETVTRQAIAMQEKLRGSDSLQEADSLCNLGDVLRHRSGSSQSGEDKSKLAESEMLIREGLAIRRKRLGNDSDKVAWALHSLQIVLTNQGKWDEAEIALQECITIFRKLHGEEHPATAYAYQSLGFLVMSRSDTRLEEAELLLHKALEIQVKTEGEGRVNQQYSHVFLAELLERRGKLVEAEIHRRAALEIVRTQLGADNPDLPTVLAPLSGLLRRKGDLAEARRLAEEAVAVCERNPGRVDRWAQAAAFGTLRDILTDLGDTTALEKLELTRQMNAKPSSPPEPPAK